MEGVAEPGRERGSGPALRGLVEVEGDLGAVGRVRFHDFPDRFLRGLWIHRGGKPEREVQRHLGQQDVAGFSSDGSPPCPVTARLGRQVRFRMSSLVGTPGRPVLPAQGSA